MCNVVGRKEASRLAREMGLHGQAAYVNKDILIKVEGDELILRQFAEWCKTGPEFCNVVQMEETEMEIIGKQGFTIVSGVVNFDIMQKGA